MRAGLLNETISFYELKVEKSASGFEKKEFVKIQDIKAYRRKLTASGVINADEDFIANTLVFQVRAYSFIKSDCRIGYNLNMYKIISLDKQSDNTYLITISKINE